MPTKKIKVNSLDDNGDVVRDKDGKVVRIDTGREYEVDGKKLTWHPLDDEDEPGNLADVTIPLRLKLKTIRDLSGRELDAANMFDILERLIPGQAEALDEMDLNDFQNMFNTWQSEYTALSGATPGE